jgi:hypothetical protein
MFFRPAEPSDASAVALVHVRAWQAGYRNLLPDEYRLDGWATDGLRRAESVWGAVVDELRYRRAPRSVQGVSGRQGPAGGQALQRRGGYSPDGLANEALHWLIGKAEDFGLEVGRLPRAFPPLLQFNPE